MVGDHRYQGRATIMATTGKLSRTILASYSLPAIPQAMLLLPIIVYFPPFYAQVVGLSLASLGVIFFIGRMWDGISDPIIGILSDKIPFRWGRRKTWLVIGTPLMMLMTWLLCQPPKGADETFLLVGLIIFYIAYTMLRIPYLSWGTELTTDYKERNKVTGYREVGTMIGIYLSVAAPRLFIPDGETNIANVMYVFTWVACILIPLTNFFAAWKVPDTTRASGPSPEVWSNFKLILKNKLYLRVLTGVGLLYLGTYMYNACMLFIIEQAMGLRGEFLNLMLIEYMVMPLCVPFFVYLAGRIGKHRAICVGAAIEIAALAMLGFTPQGSFFWAGVAYAVIGASFATWYIVPTSMIADCIDYGALKGGDKVSGSYIAFFNLFDKGALAVAALIALPMLQWVGFDAKADNSPETLQWVRIIGLLAPSLIILAAIALFWNYPLNARKHQAVLKAIARRKPREEASA